MSKTRLVVGPGQADNTTFGNLMKEFRIAAGLSRSLASHILEISQEYLRLIESGRRTPAVESMPKFFQLYEVRYTTLRGDGWSFGDWEVVFTSRIRAARGEARNPPPLDDRHTTIGQIAVLLATADEKTLKKVHRILLRN